MGRGSNRCTDWVVTVDHKKIGIDVHRLRRGLFAGRGLRGDFTAHSAGRAAQQFSLSRGLQSHLHHAWHHHGLSHGDAVDHWICQLPGPPDDRRQGHGFSPDECLQLLDDRAGRLDAVLQLHWRRGPARRRKRARCHLVGVCAAYRASILSRTQHGLLGVVADRLRIRHHRRRCQHHRHHHMHALQRHDDVPHAAAGVAVPGGFGNDPGDHQPIDCGADHADHRPLSWRPLLRFAGWRRAALSGRTSSGSSGTPRSMCW